VSRRGRVGLAARTAVAWAVVVAGIVVTGLGLAPVLAEPADGGATSTSGPAGSTTTAPAPSTTTTTTTTTAGPETTQATSTSPSTSATGSSTTTTTLAGVGPSTSGPDGPGVVRSTPDPAGAGTTTSTIAVSAGPPGGTLSISAPGLLDLGDATPGGGLLSARMGTVTVTDTRGVVDGAWTVRVSATPFTTGGGAAGQRVAPSAIAYWSGPATARSGTAVLAPGQLGPAQAVPLTTTRTAFSATGVAGDNTAAWDPTVLVRVPASAVAGRYRGAIIHSVA
jgi:hypothetical protein